MRVKGGTRARPVRWFRRLRLPPVVVRAIEAWLLARVDPLVPSRPEELEDPKRAVVDLARQSRRDDVRRDMVPRPASGRVVGPAYTARLVEFVTHRRLGWRPAVAAQSAESLARCLTCLRRLLAEAAG